MRSGRPEGAAASLIAGAFWLSLGCTVTGVTYLLAAPGEHFLVAYGAVFAGIVAFGRGVKRWSDAAQPFPLIGVLAAMAATPIIAALLVGFSAWRRESQRASRQAAEDLRLQQARAVQEEARVAAERQAADAARAQRHAERVAQARDRLLTSSTAMTLCEAALDLGHAKAREAIPDLTAVLERAGESASVRHCAASALVELGEVDRPLAFYVACAQAGTTALRAVARSGFGDIGPRAAAAAVPFLTAELDSPHMDVRYAAAHALSKLGPAAEPALRRAARDPDPTVRSLAHQALAGLNLQPEKQVSAGSGRTDVTDSGPLAVTTVKRARSCS